MNILKARIRPKINVRLVRLAQTEKAWHFTFGEPYWQFRQTFILSKSADWEAAEWMWEKVHAVFLEKAREKQWTHR